MTTVVRTSPTTISPGRSRQAAASSFFTSSGFLFAGAFGATLMTIWLLNSLHWTSISGKDDHHYIATPGDTFLLANNPASARRASPDTYCPPMSNSGGPDSAHQLWAARYRMVDAASPQCAHKNSKKVVTPFTMEPKVALSNQRRLAGGGYQDIAKGSGDMHAAGLLVNLIARIQHVEQLSGSIGEMGVHHGRFTSFLFTTARRNEDLVVADLFEFGQDQNVDQSGLGDLRRFQEGLTTYGLSAPKDLHTVFAGSTDALPFDWSVQAGFAPFRLISVDAGHTAALTFNDLQVAFCNLLNGGVVILDDWFHPGWPGVAEGFFHFTAVHSPPASVSSSLSSSSMSSLQAYMPVYPLLLCEGKLYLTNDAQWHQRYYQAMMNDTVLVNLLQLSPYAHEKERGDLLYEMNGVHYLRCKSRTGMPTADIQKLWSQRVY